MKNTWRFWIDRNGGTVKSAYYEFRSFKIYWAYYCSLYSLESKLNNLEIQFEQCKQNPSIIKILFGNSKTLKDIENMINDLKEQIKINKYETSKHSICKKLNIFF